MKKQLLMKKMGLMLGAMVLATTMLPTAGTLTAEASEFEASATQTFPDVKDFKEEIGYLAGLGIINGNTDGTFKPLDNLKRVHAVQMVLREMKITKFDAPNPGFVDMKPGNYGYDEVAKAVQLGFINGSTNKNGQKVFSPNGTLTRGEMAKILTEAYKITKDNNVRFTDVPADHWTKPYVSRLATANITNGYPDGSFKPNDKIQRQHFSAFMARHLNPVFKPAPVVPKPAPVKQPFVSLATAEKHIFSAVSPISTVSKLFYKSGSAYVGTLTPSSDELYSSQNSVVFMYGDTKKMTKIQVNTARYRKNTYVQPNGDTAILYASEAFFGVGNPGSKELNDFIQAHLSGTKTFAKEMTFGGNRAYVRVGEWDILIDFDMSLSYN